MTHETLDPSTIASLTDDELAALLAAATYEEYRFPNPASGTWTDPRAIPGPIVGDLSADQCHDIVMRALRLVDEYAVDVMTFKQSNFLGGDAEYAFVKHVHKGVGVAIDHTVNADHRVYEFIRSRAPTFVPERLADRLDWVDLPGERTRYPGVLQKAGDRYLIEVKLNKGEELGDGHIAVADDDVPDDVRPGDMLTFSVLPDGPRYRAVEVREYKAFGVP